VQKVPTPSLFGFTVIVLQNHDGLFGWLALSRYYWLL
jgi:hypothetical protein